VSLGGKGESGRNPCKKRRGGLRWVKKLRGKTSGSGKSPGFFVGKKEIMWLLTLQGKIDGTDQGKKRLFKEKTGPICGVKDCGRGRVPPREKAGPSSLGFFSLTKGGRRNAFARSLRKEQPPCRAPGGGACEQPKRDRRWTLKKRRDCEAN